VWRGNKGEQPHGPCKHVETQQNIDGFNSGSEGVTLFKHRHSKTIQIDSREEKDNPMVCFAAWTCLESSSKPSLVRRAALPVGIWQVNRSLQWAVCAIFPVETLKLVVLPIL